MEMRSGFISGRSNWTYTLLLNGMQHFNKTIPFIQKFLVKLQCFIYKKGIIMYNDNNWKQRHLLH